jgi:hypothetical protein
VAGHAIAAAEDAPGRADCGLAGGADLGALHAFLLSAVAFSVFLSWLFDRTGGSLLLTCLAHWAINFAGSSSGIYGVPAILWLWTAVWWIVVATIFVLERGCLAHRETRGLQGIP